MKIDSKVAKNMAALPIVMFALLIVYCLGEGQPLSLLRGEEVFMWYQYSNLNIVLSCDLASIALFLALWLFNCFYVYVFCLNKICVVFFVLWVYGVAMVCLLASLFYMCKNGW